MRLHRFFIGKKLNNNSQLTIDDSRLLHQWLDVFRMKVGERLVLFDGSGDDFICEIISIAKNEAEISVVEKKNGITPEKEVWLFASLIKKDNFEFVLEKATELGVSHFVPVICERSEKKGLNAERARKIIIEAAEQCGRSDIPELHGIISLGKAIDKYGDKIDLVAFGPSGETIHNSQLTINNPGILVGPEGGFTERELALFKENKIPVFSLGPFTLRAETAVLVAVTKILS